MNPEEPSPPFFPWELVAGTSDCNTPEQQCERFQELECLGWSRTDEGEWLAHLASGWLCNPTEKVFFHAERNLLVPVGGVTTASKSATEEGPVPPFTGEGPPVTEGSTELHQSSHEYEDELSESGSESDFMLDLEDDLEAATAQKKGPAENKENCEDRFVTRAGLPLGVVSGSTEALCYFTAIYDGHAGSDCADYAAAHLHKNILSCYRQLHSTVQRRRQEEMRKQGGKRRKQPQRTQWLQQLNQSFDPLRPEERRLSVEVEALVRSCFSAFSITDKNYLGLTESSLTQDAGTTACLAIFFGPDEQGALQLVTAHAGDSRAVLCRGGEALRLTEDHKPNSPGEQKRIEAAGGQVASVQGVWRVLTAEARGGRTVGLSTSRALGDLALKKPKPLVISNPTVHVYTLHFEKDAFLVLASDGIFEVMSDDEVVGLILSRLPPTPLEASQLVIDEAVKRGGVDDKTCTVVYFKWRKDLFLPKVEEDQHQQGAGVQEELQAASSGCPGTAEKLTEKEVARGSSEPSDTEAMQKASPEKDLKLASIKIEAADPASQGGLEPAAAKADDAEQDKSLIRSSGLEEIAGITSFLDVEALIRKRKREQQMEAEAAQAAAAAAAEAAEDDFDIFGGAPAPDSPIPDAVPKDSDSDSD